VASVDDAITQKAIDWLRNFLQSEHGIWFTTCVKRGETWFCYDQRGELVIKLEDAIVDRIFLAQERLEWTTEPYQDPGDNIIDYADEDDTA
jgi:hypothetical protein